MIYPDTSFLVPLYVDEPFTAKAKDFMARTASPLIFTPFHRLELRTAVRMRVFLERLPQEQLRGVLSRTEEDLGAGILHHTPLPWSKALRASEDIGAEHLTEVGARSGDLLHVASALILGAHEFLTFDQRQIALAKRAGLKVRSWSSGR